MPFIVLSADATQETRSECLETGVDAFLTKPIHSDALMSTIDMLVSTYREGGTGTFVPDISSAVAPQPAQASANNTEATLLNWQTLKQLDNLTPSRSFLENLIDDYIRDSTALMYEIEMALKAKRSSECRRLAHALKGSALGIGAARLCTLCEDIDVMPAVEMAANTDYLVSKLRRTHHDTRDALLRYKAERTEAALHFI
jgi:two-component system sensor histidine kinase RpfC